MELLESSRPSLRTMTGHPSLEMGQEMMGIMTSDREIQVMRNWKQSEGVSVHPGFGTETAFNKQTAEWRVPITLKLDQLAQAIDPSQTGDPTVQTRDVSWSAIFGYIEQAKKSYADKGENNPLRGWAREGDVAVGILERLTNLIPDENGLGILKGALAYVFQTWQIRISNVNRILQELEQVPGVLASIFQICDHYRSDVRLRNLVWDFYGTLIDCLSDLVAILNRRHNDKNFIKKLVSQLPEVEAQKIDRISERIRWAKQTVFEAVAHLDRSTWQETRQTAIKTHAAVEATRFTAHKINAGMTTMRHEHSEGLNRLTSQMDRFREEMLDKALRLENEFVREREARDQFAAALERLVAILPASGSEEMQGAFFRMMADTILQRQLCMPSLAVAPALLCNGQPMPPQPCFSAGEIIELLNTPDPTGDAERTLRMESLMGSEAIDYINMLERKPQFREWLSSERPRVILVDGCCRDEGFSTASPMSVFTASMASTLIRAQAGIVIQFFCGHHVDPRHEDAGPEGLLRSIASQLLLYPKSYDLAVDFFDQSLHDAVGSNNTDALCRLFENLFWGVDPGTPVYVLIDNVSAFESKLHGFADSMDRVFALFRRLVGTVLTGSAPGPNLKLFMASPNRSHRIVYQVDPATEYVRLAARGFLGGPRPGDRQLRETRRARSPQPPISY